MSTDSEQLAPIAEVPASTDGDRPRVVILGGGFAGLNAAKKLGDTDLEVVIVDKRNHHLFQPLLYQVATAGLNPGDIATPIRSILRDHENVRVVLGEATSIDRESQSVEVNDGTIDYDYLVVATGTQPNYFGPEEWEHESTPLKTIEDAVELRRQILYSFELAEQADDPDRVEELLTFVIVGGGPTGVEMAGAIREIAATVMGRDFRTIRTEETRVILIDAAPRILRTYPEELSENARLELEDRGVEVYLDAPVEEIDEGTVRADDHEFRTQTVIWAAGVEPVPLVDTLDAERAESGNVIVDEDLTLPDDKRVYVVGDIAHFEHNDEDPLPGLAPVAIQQGKATAENIQRAAQGEETESFEYWDRGQMATIGRKAAVAVIGEFPLMRGTRLTGFFAWLAWLFVHLLFLVGFRNKLSVIFDWVYSYIAFKRGSRLIIEAPSSMTTELRETDALPEPDESEWVESPAAENTAEPVTGSPERADETTEEAL